MSLKKQINSIPTKPGVYFFKNKQKDILYIGKAKNLKNRVRSYFNKSNTNHKSKIMVSNSSFIDFLVVNDEVEAIITEANMIKEYKPKYNILLKDDKTFPYIIITNEIYPRVEIIRKKNLHKDGNIYYGPYTDVNYLRLTVKAIHNIFPIRTCKYIPSNQKNNNTSSCFCGFCLSLKKIGKKEYNQIINKVIQFLNGKNSNVKFFLRKLMNESSSKMRYEQAAKYRDQLDALKIFTKKQKKIANDLSDRDLLHVSYKENFGIGFVMRIRSGLLIGKEKFEIKINGESFEKILNDFLIQYYNNTQDIPLEVVLNKKLSDKIGLENWLSLKNNKRIKIINPKIGEKRKMLDLCIKNADLILKNMIIKKIKRNDFLPKTLNELKEVLNMSIFPKRIEAFDNSNLQGTNAVAGMVCFINGKPIKKEYRKFNIKTVIGIDDFESMREVVFRRYSRQIKEKKSLPDLILIDGGKGQLSAAKSSIDKLGLGHITIIGLAKKLEEVYIPSSIHPQNISKTSPALYLLRKIRDEVHRFAITFHKNKRSKKSFESIFDRVNGIGKKRLKKIWDNYNSLNELKNDTLENIYIKTKIPINLITEIKDKLEG